MNVPCLDHNLAFIRAAADHLNDSQPHLCKNVVLSVSHSGLAAEEAGHLSRDEQLALSDAVSTFSRSTLSSLSDQVTLAQILQGCGFLSPSDHHHLEGCHVRPIQ